MEMTLCLNGSTRAVDAAPGTLLVDLLRREGCFSVKHGCETGDCGVCAVLVDGLPVASCIQLAASASGRQIVTIDGLAGDPRVEELQRAFAESGAVQCGYCTPAMIIVSYALLARTPDPEESEIRDALTGVLCRCTGYVKPVQAVLRVAAEAAAVAHA